MRLSPALAFYLQASIVLFFLAGAIAPTPLYALYQARWGFSPVTVTVVFGIYAVAVLAALLVVGSLSDHVGRRPVLLVATAVQAATMGLFIHAGGVADLVVARVVQGLAVGLAAGAVGAGMLDLDKQRGASANAVAPMLGTATGGLVSGLMVQYLPAPTTLVYLFLGAVFVLQFVGVWLMPESVTPRPGALASLRPSFHVPARVRGALLVAAPALVAAWALPGFYGSLGPALVRGIVGSTAPALGGLTMFVLAASAAAAIFVARELAPRAMMARGTMGLLVGVAITLVAAHQHAAAVFFLGAVVAGAGFGGAFQGAIRMVVPLAEPHERAGVLSVVYVIAYLAMGVPAVLAGLRVVHGGGLLHTATEYGLVVMALSALALLGTLAPEQRPVAVKA